MRFLLSAVAVLVVLSGLGWWLLIEGSAPQTTSENLDIGKWRELVSDDQDTLPTAIEVEIVGTDDAPGFAAEAGDFGGSYKVAYTAFSIVWADGKRVVIDGAVDADVAAEMEQSPETATFDEAAYGRMLDALGGADAIYLTHAHSDHIVGILQHPKPEKLAGSLRVRTWQKQAMDSFYGPHSLPAPLDRTVPFDIEQPTRVAPGVVLIPTAGHTPSSQSFFVRTQDGFEFLLIGDIVWKMSNIDNLKTRPRLLQYMLFDPPEDRDRVLGQVRALHDLREAEPALTILPSHDRTYLDGLIREGRIRQGFYPIGADATSR